MIVRTAKCGREPQLESAAARHGLDAIARLVFGGPIDDESQLRSVAQVGQTLAHGGGEATADLAFFLIAWAAERIAAQRIADDGLDAGESPDEMFIEALNEFREFAMVVQFIGKRDLFRHRWATGQRQLAAYCPDSANDLPPLALAG